MDKLNVFEGKPGYHPGTENRLTWAFLNLIRLSPFVCAAFLDIVREQQKRPIPGFTTLRERECIVHTQVGTLWANEGRLVAIGITEKGKEVDIEIHPEEREAIYDGVVTIIAPEHRRHEQESLTLIIESKLGTVIDGWQLKPSKGSLGEEQKVDRQAVILAWRDILSTLTDLELRELLSPTEKILIRDFIDYVDKHHPQLNPFDHFGVCRGDLNLLNRRCKAILRKIDPNEAWHRSSPIIKVEKDAFKQIWLKAEERTARDSWQITLELWPGVTMEQARPFWEKVDTGRLLTLQEKGWRLHPNLLFAYAGTHLVGSSTQLSVEEYIKYWKSHHENEIDSLYPDVAGSFLHNWKQLVKNGLISDDDVKPLEEESTQTKRPYLSMSPGLGVCYTWPAKKAVELDRSGMFTDEVKKKIREATETWGEVPGFCGEG